MVLTNQFMPGAEHNCLIDTPRWNSSEATLDGEAYLEHHEEEGKIQTPESPGMLGLPFVEFSPSSLSHPFKQSKDVKDVAFRSSFVDELFEMAIPSSVEVSSEFIPQQRENKQILKRRRSLDDDYQRKQVKREKSKQLYERRRSLDSCVTLKSPPYRPLRAAAPPTVQTQVQSRTPKRSNLWTYEEEVFLVAAVMECFLRRGSLTSNRGRDGCWSEIKSFFDLFITNYNKVLKRSKKPGTERASSALYRHFKTLKERISKDPSKDLREYYHRFQFEYNRNNRLLQPPQRT